MPHTTISPILNKSKNIPDAFFALSEQYPDTTIYSQAIIDEKQTSGPRTWESRSFKESAQRIKRLIAFLSPQVDLDTKVALLSGTRPEWMEADIAILACGGVSVSVYQSLNTEEIAYILFDSEAEIVFAENAEQVEKLLQITEEEFTFEATESRPQQSATLKFKQIITFETVEPHPLVISIDEILQREVLEDPKLPETITRDSLAALVYTSGTTGPPKGVMQTHGNHLSNVRQAFESGMLEEAKSLVLFLPLAHSFAKLLGYIGMLSLVELRYPGICNKKSSRINPASVTQDIRESNAYVIPVVPRLLEKMRDGILERASQKSIQGCLLQICLASTAQYYRDRKNGTNPSLLTRIGMTGTKSVRDAIKRGLFGSQFQFCLSGGAKLPPTLSQFFTELGITVLEGYGLTETAVATNVARPHETPLGSVGPVLADDIEVKITSEGEIAFRGPNVALGYYRRPQATEESWDQEGWFYTGDLGHLDEDENLFITGRKKEIIVTSGGKNIAPHDIEEEIKKLSIISQAVLIGDGRKNCVSIVTLHNQPTSQYERPLNEQDELRRDIANHLEKINEHLSRYERVYDFYIADEEFSIENGLLTPTFKTKRPKIEALYAAQIEALYN